LPETKETNWFRRPEQWTWVANIYSQSDENFGGIENQKADIIPKQSKINWVVYIESIFNKFK